ncbi:hypothetical protein MIMGU_mgv1a0070052mg, partial [Erythranthe guttata]|jgi:hypothetical protein
MGH